MKRIGLFMLAVLTAATFSACNDSDGDFPGSYAFATVKPLSGNDFYFVLDDAKTVYASDKSRIPTYHAEEGERVLIFFNILNTPVKGYDYNIALYILRNIYSGETKVVNTQEELETLPDNKVSLFGPRLNSYYLNTGIGFYGKELSKHKFYLVRNNVSELEPEHKADGYLNLELRHDEGGDEYTTSFEDLYVSFSMENFKQDLEGKKGIILRVSTRQNGIQYVTVPLRGE